MIKNILKKAVNYNYKNMPQDGAEVIEGGLLRFDNMTRSLLRMNDGADYMGGVGRSLTEGDDAILKGANADDAAAFFRGESDTIAGVGDDVVGNLTNVRANMQEQLKEGGTEFTNEAVRAMYRNVSEGGNVNAGLSAAGMTRSNIPGFQAMGDPSNLLGSMAMGGLLGAGAANIVGGDPMDGATLGAMAGAAGSIGARAFRESIGDIETSVMKKVLKKDFATTEKAETKLLPGGGVKTKGGRTFMDSGEVVENNRVDNFIPDPNKMNNLQRIIMSRPGSQPFDDGITVETGRMISARSQNLNALADQGRDTSGLGRVDKFIYDRMMDPKKTSLGMQSRMATASGAMLAGAMFSSARTKDKRRGFNRNRGNRF